MRRNGSLIAWLLSGALVVSHPTDAAACAFHGYTPDPTLVDVLLATDQVVIARIDATGAQRYDQIEVLNGPSTSDTSILSGAQGDASRDNPNGDQVLIARDGAYGPWIELAMLDDRFRDLTDQILSRKSAWQLGNDKDRLSFFAARLNDQNPDIRRLALQEMDRVDYRALQNAKLPVIQNLRQDLNSGDDDLRPIRILLAGLSRDSSYRALLATKLDTAVQKDLPYLGAFATALIEQGQTEAVQTILDRYLTDKSLTLQTRERLLEALSIQYKVSRGGTRRYIARGVASLLRTAPELKEAAAIQFGFAIVSEQRSLGTQSQPAQSIPRSSVGSVDR